MDYLALKGLLMPPHGVAGVIAICAGLGALALPKAPGAHPWAGRAFMVSMALAICIAAPVILAGQNLFLLGVALLVLYHGGVAWRLARLQPPKRLPTALDRSFHGSFALAFVALACLGGFALSKGSGMGVVGLVLGGISLVSVRRFRRFMGQEQFEEGAWVAEHVHGVAAAFIASITAFTAATGPRIVPEVPHWMLWLGPTLILTPLFVRFGRRSQQ